MTSTPIGCILSTRDEERNSSKKINLITPLECKERGKEMKNLYVNYNNDLIYVGYIEPFVYEGETLYKIERVGMFTQVYNSKQLREFLDEHTFIIK